MTRLHLRSNAPYALGAALLAALLYSMLWIGAAHADTCSTDIEHLNGHN